ncbi:GNAT family N-acetyltransferase [Chelativorans sp.]|uniref:GNAT family N-acetyltransferase n=1 Tax=Chelativorans sp. TaxID=2203393 RepID=UPI0028126311|nr:GNAT family N-acetyltransferase [Chelativorans sp.]
MLVIETRRCALRDFLPEDEAAFAAYQRDPRFAAAREEAGQEAADPAWLLRLFAEWAAEEPRLNFQLAVIDRADGALIGCAGLRTKDCAEGQGELGIELAADYWSRHGLALEIARALIDFGLSRLALSEIVGITTYRNRKAARLAAFLGGRLEEAPAGGAVWRFEKSAIGS